MANEITDEDLENVVPIVVEEFKELLAKAIEVLNSDNANQEEVNAAFDKMCIRDRVITVSRDIISKTIFKEITPEVISSIKDLNIDVKFENGEYSIGGITALDLNKNEYVGIALPKANKLSEVIINASDYEGLVLEYSLNGIEWSEAETNITDGVMSSNNSICLLYTSILMNISLILIQLS